MQSGVKGQKRTQCPMLGKKEWSQDDKASSFALESLNIIADLRRAIAVQWEAGVRPFEA